MSRHFIWLVPLTDLLILLLVGLVGSLVVILRPSGGRWAVVRTLCALTLLPMLLVAFPQVYGLAWLLVALGLSARLVPVLERHGAAFRRVVLYSSPILAGTLAALAALPWAADRVQQRRERGRPIPPDAPNILLIVMDTVAADHLALYGYERPTSPAIDELARRGSRFDAAHLGLLVDPPLAREHVHRAMASRAVGRLADPARRGRADGGRVPACAGVCHGGLHRQHVVLRRRLGVGPRLHRLSRLHLPGALAVQDGGDGPEVPRRVAGDRGRAGRRPRSRPG